MESGEILSMATVKIISFCDSGISGILVLVFYRRQHAQHRATCRYRFYVLISELFAFFPPDFIFRYDSFVGSVNRAHTARRASESKLSLKIDNCLGFYLCQRIHSMRSLSGAGFQLINTL